MFATAAYSLLVKPEELGSETGPHRSSGGQKVAELLSNGLGNIESHNECDADFGLIGGTIALVEMAPKIKVHAISSWYWVSMMVPFYYSFSMFLGAIGASTLMKAKRQFAAAFLVVIASGLGAGETSWEF